MGNAESSSSSASSNKTTLQHNLVFKDKDTNLDDHYHLYKKDGKKITLRGSSGDKHLKDGCSIVIAESKRYTKSKRGKNGYAIKVFKRNNSSSSSLDKLVSLGTDGGGAQDAASPPDFKEEARLLQLCDHPNIIRLYHLTTERKKGVGGMTLPGSAKNVSLVLELCSGGPLKDSFPFKWETEMMDAAQKKAANKRAAKRIEKEAQSVVRQVMYAVAHLHYRNIVHRGIEMSNIMYKTQPNHDDENDFGSKVIKLIDFGLATQQQEFENNNTKGEKRLLKDKIGPIHVMAPEVVRGEYGPKCDIWSIGILAYNLLMDGKQIYVGKTDKEIETKIKDRLFAPNFTGFRHSTKAKEFIKKCLIRNDTTRPSAVELLQHDWLKPTVSMEDIGLISDEDGEEEIIILLPNNLLVSFQLYLQANQLKRVSLNALAKNYTLLPEYQRIFSLLDRTYSGSLSKEEFMKAFTASGFSSHEIERLFTQMDMNETGAVDYTEWVAATLEASGELEEDQIQEAFDLLDEDRSGAITKKNLVTLLIGKNPTKLKRIIKKSTTSAEEVLAARKMADEILQGKMKLEYEEFARLFEFTFHDRKIKPIVEVSLNEEQILYLMKKQNQRQSQRGLGAISED